MRNMREYIEPNYNDDLVNKASEDCQIMQFGMHTVKVISNSLYLVEGIRLLCEELLTSRFCTQKLLFIESRFIYRYPWGMAEGDFRSYKVFYLSEGRGKALRFYINGIDIDASLYDWRKTINQVVTSQLRVTDALAKIIEPLTAREREVYALLLDNRTATQISDILSIDRKTVYCHRRNIAQKFHCDNSLHLSLLIVSDNFRLENIFNRNTR
ncbi:helix-turn-helix transcriptional regulator [Rahnella bruchi]|uniref:helix-turn-helix domain-containing protein n=1 Tax=Rahnella bruchi TaxID=1510573 RepID=UPI000EA3CD1A|nr:helix-turn-helix transcriptional regulator [Rahnella bruchi]